MKPFKAYWIHDKDNSEEIIVLDWKKSANEIYWFDDLLIADGNNQIKTISLKDNKIEFDEWV